MTVVVFDSGLGGLSIVRAMRGAGVAGRIVYLADHAGFPYGGRADADVIGRTLDLAVPAVLAERAAALVVACNTASTLVLPPLRARLEVPVVGTVPAIKPAAERTRSGLVSVLATPGTVARDYTRDLVAKFAGFAEVTLVGAGRLAGEAERAFAGGRVDPEVVAAEIAPAFVEQGGRRTDTVVLACTHFPLIAEALAAAAPWPVDWIDPAPAIARRLLVVAPMLRDAAPTPGLFRTTDPRAITPEVEAALGRLGLAAAEG